MRAKTILTALFAVSLIIAAIAAMQIMTPKGGAATPKEQILAATGPLSAGTFLRAADVSWLGVSETKPDQMVRPNAAALAAKPEADTEAMGSVYGAVLRHPLAAGEPIRRGDFVKPADRDFLQVVLTPGARAIAIPVATGGASTGLLSPGDRVDVILTQNFKNDNAQDLKNTPVTRRSVSETVVDNLRVLAIDAPDSKAIRANPNPAAANPATGSFGRTVTLEVSADQAEQINVATELGKLSLILRSDKGNDSTRLVAASPEREQVKPKWAGDVSPALSGAVQTKPVAITPPTVQVFHGAGREGGGSGTGTNIRSEIVKPEN